MLDKLRYNILDLIPSNIIIIITNNNNLIIISFISRNVIQIN